MNDKNSKTVDAIHKTSTRDMLVGPAKAATPLFQKTNTPTGAVVTDRLTGGSIVKVNITADAKGNPSEADSTYACEGVRAVHNAVTDVKGAVERNRK